MSKTDIILERFSIKEYTKDFISYFYVCSSDFYE